VPNQDTQIFQTNGSAVKPKLISKNEPYSIWFPLGLFRDKMPMAIAVFAFVEDGAGSCPDSPGTSNLV
jgi:hypothetical protein